MTKPMTFQEWYTSISIEGDMKHNMGRAWDAALASLQSPAQDPSVWVDRAMTLAQEFASSWSLVGGRFDSGDGLAIAEAAKAELRAFLESTPLPQAAQPDHVEESLTSDQQHWFDRGVEFAEKRAAVDTRKEQSLPEQAAPKILTIGQRVAAVRALQDYVEQALDEYELCGDEGYYTPNKDESLLIHDCVQGLLADQDFIRLVAALALPYVEPTAAPASPSLATERDAVDAQKVRDQALELDLPRFVNGVREFVLGQLHGNLASDCYDRVRAVDPAWLANMVLESQEQPMPTKPQIYISETELEAFHRFCECCEDSGADGYDVSQDMMKRLAEVGLVRSLGFKRYMTTRYGDAIRALQSQPASAGKDATDLPDEEIDRLHRIANNAAYKALGAGASINEWRRVFIRELLSAAIAQKEGQHE